MRCAGPFYEILSGRLSSGHRLRAVRGPHGRAARVLRLRARGRAAEPAGRFSAAGPCGAVEPSVSRTIDEGPYPRSAVHHILH